MDIHGNATTRPTQIIFNDGKSNNAAQTSDLDFSNGGYYNEAGALQGVVTGIVPVKADTPTGTTKIYTLDGREVKTPQHGVYIVNGKKVMVK